GIESVCVTATAVECASKTTSTLKRTNEERMITVVHQLETRNDEQAATDSNQVFDHRNVEVWLGQELNEPGASVVATETTDDSSDQSQRSTDVSRLSTAKRNACAREATGHDTADKT